MGLFADSLENERAVSVTDFTRRVKQLLEGGIAPCWVRGEVSNVRQQSSGHVYFSLKDSGAQLSAVMFRADALRQKILLRDGLQVLVYGEISVYEARGQYQLIVRLAVEDGVGRLQREFEALKRRLADEGLFDAARKVPIPPMPATVAFITSPTGAAVQDFLRILSRRKWCGRVVVVPAKVQGAGAAEEMVEQLALLQAHGGFDLLVIGRGGGSLEDLWAFNEEVLVRAVAACGIPIISAVGHEIDFTLCDFAADARAETPSAAAELISSNFIEHVRRLGEAVVAADSSATRLLKNARASLEHGASRLRLLSPAARVERDHLRLDDLSNRLGGALRAADQAYRHRYDAMAGRFLRCTPEPRIQRESHRLLAVWKRLQSVSPASVLNRGFVIVRDQAGKPVTRSADVGPGQHLELQFGDGSAQVTSER